MTTTSIIGNTDHRVQLLNSAPVRPDAKYVLYWAQVNRRVGFNHGLAFAVDLAKRAGLPVVFYEGLTFDYPFASGRFNTFILNAVPDTRRACERLGIRYVFYHRKSQNEPNDKLYRLAKDAAAVVTDDYPLFPSQRYNASVPGKIGVPYYAVDSSCIIPMSRFEKREYAAYTIRPKIKKLLPEYLKPITAIRVEGVNAAQEKLRYFLKNNLHRYANLSNQPSENATSGLSPYLHFGHISSLEIALAVRDYAREHKLLPDEFLEELIVRRELAFNFARFTEHPDSLDALPDWARKT